MTTAPIHQLIHTLSYGDAISTEVLALQRCFRASGRESEIFAINVHPLYKGKAHDYRSFPNDFPGEAILHYSLGSPLNELYKSLNGATRSLIYHNLTPPEWFEGVNPRIVDDIRRGMHELPSLCAMTDRLVADSKFNASELGKLGFEAEVLELPIDGEKWNVPANPGIAALVRGSPGLHVLHVGRIAPNKCVEDIIKSFFFLHHYIRRDSRLWLVGIDTDTELYSFSLKCLVNVLNLDQAVSFTGPLADSEVRALYENCSVYMCASEHEGFCLPVIEAMHFGLPVVSYSSSALPDTIASGGILFSEKRHAHIAELIDIVATDSALRQSLIDAGKKRVAELSFSRFEERVAKTFGPLLSPRRASQGA